MELFSYDKFTSLYILAYGYAKRERARMRKIPSRRRKYVFWCGYISALRDVLRLVQETKFKVDMPSADNSELASVAEELDKIQATVEQAVERLKVLQRKKSILRALLEEQSSLTKKPTARIRF